MHTISVTWSTPIFVYWFDAGSWGCKEDKDILPDQTFIYMLSVESYYHNINEILR